MKTTHKTIMIYPTQNGKKAPGIAVDVDGGGNDQYKQALKEAKERSGLARFKSWEFI